MKPRSAAKDTAERAAPPGSDEQMASMRLSSRLRLARQIRGMTLKGVADAAGCSESLLSKIENGKATPSLPMLHRLVQALETNIGWMFEESDGDEGIVFRRGARPLITLDPLRQGEGISLERVIPYSNGHLLQCNIHHIEVGGESAGPIQHVGEEVGYILEGDVELTVASSTFRLCAGDSFVFRSELPHHYRNAGARPASIFWVNTPPTF
ncbi:helix-turn-helix domain-containing protein [Labrys monachus]|uniref:Transcriptional regulator with XRE-family HTH domain n=1 Tax=Labrys monachus TaxID=217067 RepID=A0ABU0FLL3_9HYPH|nr:XRE family transcriptional regulator [Labrys monachus]MDQ0395009.1 transcriptional regulator with XRE-family HTH domain [Labrys monachus]